jgi:hypothetical protein
MPPVDPIAEWMLEMTASLERLSARVQAVEKSTDGLGGAVASSNATAAAAASALMRIAKTEEGRLAFETRVHEGKLKAEQEDKRRSDQWLQRIWSAQPVQLAVLGLVLALLQYLGVSHMMSELKGSP